MDNLKVRFADGKDALSPPTSWGMASIKMQNLDLVGSLAAQNGVLGLAVESYSPRRIAANFVRPRSTRRWRTTPRSGTWKKYARGTGGWSCESDGGHRH